MTKLELQQRLDAVLKENVALRHELSVARADVQRMQRASEVRRPAHFEAAREAAMRLGRSVRVEVSQ